MIVPNPKIDAVLGAGARGNYFRCNSLYRAKVIEFAAGYSKITPVDWAKKRSFVGDNVIDPILSAGGRFLVIDKEKTAGAYIQLHLDNKEDLKTAVKAIQQAFRDESKSQARRLKKEQDRFADAAENNAAFAANHNDNHNHVHAAGTSGTLQSPRKKRKYTKRKSKSLLPTRNNLALEQEQAKCQQQQETSRKQTATPPPPPPAEEEPSPYDFMAAQAVASTSQVPSNAFLDSFTQSSNQAPSSIAANHTENSHQHHQQQQQQQQQMMIMSSPQAHALHMHMLSSQQVAFAAQRAALANPHHAALATQQAALASYHAAAAAMQQAVTNMHVPANNAMGAPHQRAIESAVNKPAAAESSGMYSNDLPSVVKENLRLSRTEDGTIYSNANDSGPTAEEASESEEYMFI